MTNIPVVIIDDKGQHTVTMNDKFVRELAVKLRNEGVTQVHTYSAKGVLTTYNAQALVVFAKGAKGSLLFIGDTKE